jgi:hypothetical protein
VFDICKKDNNFILLEKTVQDINSDYLMSADYKMRKNWKSGLVCGYDCPHYEEHREACPFTFWENDKTQIDYLINLLNNDKLIKCLNEYRGYNVI